MLKVHLDHRYAVVDSLEQNLRIELKKISAQWCDAIIALIVEPSLFHCSRWPLTRQQDSLPFDKTCFESCSVSSLLSRQKKKSLVVVPLGGWLPRMESTVRAKGFPDGINVCLPTTKGSLQRVGYRLGSPHELCYAWIPPQALKPHM